jgi:hypothetical protein
LIKRYVPEFAHGEDYIISFAIPDGSMIKDRFGEIRSGKFTSNELYPVKATSG